MKNLFKTAFCGLLVVAFLINASSAYVSATAVQEDERSAEAAELEAAIIKQIQEARKRKGLPPLTEDEIPKPGQTSKPKSRRGSTNSRPRPVVKAQSKPATNKKSTGVIRGESPAREFKKAAPTEMLSASKDFDPEVRIQFSFEQEEWQIVLQWLADELGFGLFSANGFPEGTFSCDEPEMSLTEALDYLNNRLGLLDPPHVLVRNGNQLVLINESAEYPQALIPVVSADKLDQLGRYEVVRCEFDLGSLDGESLQEIIRSQISEVHQSGFTYVPPINLLEIRERVFILRKVRNWIQTAQNSQVDRIVYQCKHIEPENLLFVLRQLLGIEPDAFTTANEDLRFSVQPYGDTIFLSGTQKRLSDFENWAKVIDVPAAQLDDANNDKPRFFPYAVTGEIEKVFGIMDLLLGGEVDTKLDIDAVTGVLYVWGPERVHERVKTTLAQMGAGKSFDGIAVQFISPSEAIEKLESLMGIDKFDEESTGPRFVADSDNNQVLVNGTPVQVTQAREMIKMIDLERVSRSGPRRSSRFIPTTPSQAKKVMDFLEIPGIMGTLGRSNRLNLIMPKDRENFGRNRMLRDRELQRQQPEESGGEGSSSKNNFRSDTNATRGFYETTSVKKLRGEYVGYASAPARFTQEERTNGNSGSGSSNRNSDEEPSVAGAPIDIQFTEQGILINSKDLDAGDDLESRIWDILDSSSEVERPQIIPIRHRKVTEIESVVKKICGLNSSGGGGGGGGLADAVGGAFQNALGGAAGNAVDSLLGLGGDSGGDSAGAYQLEGEEVNILSDSRLNYLIISGATTNDMEFLLDVINLFDVDSPTVKVEDIGKSYQIPVNYRDPEYIRDIVQTQLASRFNSGNQRGQANQGQNGNNQALQQAVLRQLQNRGRRGAGGQQAEEQAPKATLGVDVELGAILVTGPESIYLEVKELVEILDTKASTSVFTYKGGVSASYLARQMQKIDPDLIIIKGDEDDQNQSAGQPGQTSGGNRNRGSQRNGNNRSRNQTGNNRPNANQLRNQIFNQVRRGGRGR